MLASCVRLRHGQGLRLRHSVRDTDSDACMRAIEPETVFQCVSTSFCVCVTVTVCACMPRHASTTSSGACLEKNHTDARVARMHTSVLCVCVRRNKSTTSSGGVVQSGKVSAWCAKPASTNALLCVCVCVCVCVCA